MARDKKYTKHPINLRPGDYAALQAIAEVRDTTASFIIRRMVSRIVDQHRDNLERLKDTAEEVEIETEITDER